MMGINRAHKSHQKQTRSMTMMTMTTPASQNNKHMAITPRKRDRRASSPIRIRHHSLSPLHLRLLTHLPAAPGIDSCPKAKHPPRHLTPLPNIHIQSRRPRPLHPSRPAPDDGELVRAHPPDIQQHVEDDQRRPGEDGDDAEEDLRHTLALALHPLSAVLPCGRRKWDEGSVRRSERPSSRRRLGSGEGWSTTPWLSLEFL